MSVMCRDIWLTNQDILKICEMYDEDINPNSVSVTLSSLHRSGLLETRYRKGRSLFYRLAVTNN